MKTVEVLDLFEFSDGVRWAYVTWLLGDGERRVVAVRDTGWKPIYEADGTVHP